MIKDYSYDFSLWFDEIKNCYLEHYNDSGDFINTEKILKKKYSDFIIESDFGYLFFLAVADAQWELGHITEKNKKIVNDILNSEIDIKTFKKIQPKALKSRKKFIKFYLQKINSPTPTSTCEPKKIIKSINIENGDVFAYKITCEESKKLGLFNKYILLKKVDYNYNLSNELKPLVQIFNWIGDTIPKKLCDFSNTRVLMLDPTHPCKFHWVIEDLSNETRKNKWLTYVGNMKEDNLKDYNDYIDRTDVFTVTLKELGKIFIAFVSAFTKNNTFRFDINNSKIYFEEVDWIYLAKTKFRVDKDVEFAIKILQKK